MTDPRNELKPCPFCNATGERLVPSGNAIGIREMGHDVWHYRVHCVGCGCNVDNSYETEAEAIAAWNTRIARTADGPESVAGKPLVDMLNEFDNASCRLWQADGNPKVNHEEWLELQNICSNAKLALRDAIVGYRNRVIEECAKMLDESIEALDRWINHSHPDDPWRDWCELRDRTRTYADAIRALQESHPSEK